MSDRVHVAGKKQNSIIFCAGLTAVLFMVVPYLILGQDAVFTYHDQLDGELIAYLLQAKHLFQGTTLPEFLGGAGKTALIPPAPAFVLLFLAGNGYVGLVCMQMLGSICGYVGMYLLIYEAAGKVTETTKAEQNKVRQKLLPFVAMVVGVLYAYLPFLPVYGLSQYGLPLLLWCLLQAKDGKRVKLAYGYGAVYALTSSLVLVGFGVLGVLAVWMIGYRLFGNRKQGYPGHVLGIWSIMLVLYLAENLGLLAQMLGIGEQGKDISHKAEYVLAANSFGNGLFQNFCKGGQHSTDYHQLFLAAVLCMLVIGLLIGGSKRLVGIIGICLLSNFAFSGIAALWDSAFGVTLRSHMSALGAFQLNRLMWLAPCLWYLALACSLLLAGELLIGRQGKKKLLGTILSMGMIVVLCVTGGRVFLESNLKPNIQKLRNRSYSMLSFRDYYAVGVLEQVETYLYETTGQKKEDYYVVSLGIDPAAALYHGFYCLDGYSNNYSLDYKHAFRKVIMPELEKSEYLTAYYNDWGNRCYLLSAECPGYYTIEKNGFYFQNYSLDTEALKQLGGKYLFSAAYIKDAENTGLKLLRETPFETEDSYYRIFLYEIE